MKTWKLTALRRMELREAPDPEIKSPDDVLLRQGAVGVCGSDVHYYLRGRIGSQVVQYPFTVGHECAAIVERTGANVSRLKPGDRVAIDPAISCGQCDQCQVGRPHTCRKLKFLGCPGQSEGCLSEFFIMPQECCYPVPAGMSLEQAALAEPLSIGLYAVRLAEARPGQAVAVLGAGPIGLSVLACLRAAGIEQVYVTDKIEPRLAAARANGAAWAGNASDNSFIKTMIEAEPLQFDAVYECCGQQDAVDAAVELLKPGGSLMLIGIPETDRISFAIDKARRKELRIQNVRRQCHCMTPALEMVADGRACVDYMLTHRFRFENIPEAFEIVADYKDGVIKAMILM